MVPGERKTSKKEKVRQEMQGTQPDNKAMRTNGAADISRKTNQILAAIYHYMYHGQWQKLQRIRERLKNLLVLLAESQKQNEKLQLGWIFSNCL